jgi:hypothetical protein
MNLQQLERLIDNAWTARDNVKSDWGRNYWDCVIAYLLRTIDRLN